MKRLSLAVAAIALLLAAPVWAAANPATVRVTPWPASPPRRAEGGDMFISAGMFDGTTWRIVGGLSIQPEWPEPLTCEAPLRPTPVGI